MTPLLAQHLGTERSFERLYRRYAVDDAAPQTPAGAGSPAARPGRGKAS